MEATAVDAAMPARLPFQDDAARLEEQRQQALLRVTEKKREEERALMQRMEEEEKKRAEYKAAMELKAEALRVKTLERIALKKVWPSLPAL